VFSKSTLDTPKSRSFFPVLESLTTRANTTRANLGAASPFTIEEQPKVAPKVAADLGEQTDDVLHELGFEGTQINSLRTGGVVPAKSKAGIVGGALRQER
jgi:hypothetical protein